MNAYPVTGSGIRLTLGYPGYAEVLQLSHDLQDLFKRRVRLRHRLIRIEEEILAQRPRQTKSARQWRRGHSVLSFYDGMSSPASRPRTRLSEPARPTSRQTPVRERSSLTLTRPSSRQTLQRPISRGPPAKKDSLSSRSESNSTIPEINLDETYVENFGPETDAKPLWYPEPDSPSSSSSPRSSIKLQAPVLPSMRLQRETTSFGVYSNLSSHNRYRTPTPAIEETVPVAEGVQLQILDAIRQNNTAKVRFILDSNPKLNLAFADEFGDPVLHVAIKTSNTEIVELLLDRQISLETPDKDGRSVLHLSASQGSLRMVDLLLKGGLDINIPNKVTRRTALHDAVAGCHRNVIELLLLRGINPDIKGKNGQTAPSYCSPNYLRKEYDKTLSTVATTKIDIMKLHRSGVTYFTNTSLAIDTTPSKLAEESVVICKRQGADQCGLTFNIQDTDDVTSDVFIYRFEESIKGLDKEGYWYLNFFIHALNPMVLVLIRIETMLMDTKHIGFEPLSAVVTLPVLYTPRSSKEELKIKTQDGLTLTPSKIVKNNQGWQCMCTIKLGQSGAFVVVCRPAIEEFEVGRDIKVVTLEKDPRVKVSMMRGTFDQPSLITLRVLEPSDDTEIEENQVLSSTPFYRIDSSIPPSKPLTIELPIPDDYKPDESSQTVVLTQQDGYQDWRVEENVHNTGNQTISFNTQHLPLHAIVARVVPSYKKDTLSKEINDVFKQMTTRDSTVSFLCMTKRSIKINKFLMAVECCEDSMVDARRRVWTSKGYIEQKQRDPLDKFSTSAKQAFNVIFYDNIVTMKNKRADVLRYHPKRDSVVMFELPDDVPLVSARVFIYRTDDTNMVNVDEIAENRKYLLKRIDIMKVEFTREKTSIRPEYILDSMEKGPLKDIVFLTDNLLEELLVEMDTEWYKICILMGVSFRQVENAIVIEGKLKHNVKELMQTWRNEKQSREDIGLPLLMSALFKGGHRDIANFLQIELKKWYSNREDKEISFYKWVTRAYKDSDLLVPSDYPKPMSDEYLVLMADDLTPSDQLARALNLTDTEADSILHSDTYLLDGIRVMKMLTLFRDTISNRIDSLQRLIACLEELGLEKMRKYSVMCARAWLKRTATRKDDPLRYQVDAYLKKQT